MHEGVETVTEFQRKVAGGCNTPELPDTPYFAQARKREVSKSQTKKTSYSLHTLRYLLHSEGIPFPRVIIVFEYYKGRRLRPKEVVYFGRLEPVDPPALVHHGGQGLVAYCSSILTEVSFLQLRFRLY